MEFFRNFFIWLRSTFSETDGTGSSSRVLTFLLALFSCGVLWVFAEHIVKLTDVAILTAWLSSFPIIVTSLVLFFTAPYGVNKGSGSISDFLNMLKRKD